MNRPLANSILALTALGAALATLPALAVQVSFSGSNQAVLGAVSGADIMGNTWTTSNGPQDTNSSFTMADALATPQEFNRLNFLNGLGTFANSFQLTVNKSQQGAGFTGILQSAVASGLENEFIVKPSTDPTTWYSWNTSYNLLDLNGFYQQILFTAPLGTKLSQGEDFNLNVNFAGIITTDSGWAASWDDRFVPTAQDIPEPGSLALVGLGLAGLIALRRRSTPGR